MHGKAVFLDGFSTSDQQLNKHFQIALNEID